MKPSETNAIYERVISHCPPSIAATFTPIQQDALKSALQHSGWKRHPIDIRFTIPLPGQSFHMVLLVGPECRRVQRSSSKDDSYGWIVSMALSSLALGSMLLLELIQHVPSITTSWTATQPHANAMTWIHSQAECQASGQVWREGHCWEATYDSTF